MANSVRSWKSTGGRYSSFVRTGCFTVCKFPSVKYQRTLGDGSIAGTGTSGKRFTGRSIRMGIQRRRVPRDFFKIEGLKVEKRLKANKLLPQIDLQYNFLTETPEVVRSFSTADYKGGVMFRFPLFLRKERGDLKLAKLKRL